MMSTLPFIPALKFRRSAGVPVTISVHKMLRAANMARDQRRWSDAAALYKKALDEDATLGHIWIQYGHMQKEAGRLHDAMKAYLCGEECGQLDDAQLHVGHLHKDSGDSPAAMRAYLRAAKANPANGDAILGLHALMSAGAVLTTEELMSVIQMDQVPLSLEDETMRSASDRASAALSTLRGMIARDVGGTDSVRLKVLDEASAMVEALASKTGPGDADHVGATPAIVFDVSDLISYFKDARLPTGIQRVQIETICAALQSRELGNVLVCAFLDYRDEWVEIPAPMFRLICRMSLESGDRAALDWLSLLTRLRLEMTMSDALEFPVGAFLINLGTSWWLQNYFLYIRKAKAASGIRYVPFVHDLIPVMASEHCVKELTQDFITWAIGAFEHADYFLVNSHSTQRDLLRVGAYLGHSVDADAVAVVQLDADFRKPASLLSGPATLAGWGIGRGDFVLFVSTVESRKNHLGAFDAWINLIKTHGLRKVPYLVCVGNRGWLNDMVYARLEAHQGLRDRVIMLSGLTDSELDLLYRLCLFTLYPSNYEGWGLPVTESLCYGKVPLISDASSLPEAGGPFAKYFEAGSTQRLAEALEQLIFDRAHRDAMEVKIAAEFRPRQWSEITGQIVDTLAQWQSQVPDDRIAPRVPVAQAGAYHPIVRNFETRIWPGLRSAEIFRAGSGWWGPDNWGCWTKSQGGALEIALSPEIDGPIRFYLQLHGLPTRATYWIVRLAETEFELAGELAPGAFKWVAFDIADLPVGRVLQLNVHGDAAVDLRTVTDGSDPRIVSVGVAAFYYCKADDAAARATFVEAVALGNLSDLAFNREPTGDRRQLALA